MADKLNDYVGWAGRFHCVRDRYREKWARWKEEHPRGVKEMFAETMFGIPNSDDPPERVWQDSAYSDIFRRKSRIELMRISAAVMGIEFSYAGETAFVSPTLLQIGVPHQQMTLMWALSPLIGFFMTPFLGSLSDRCKSRFGRRRPFIVLMSVGVLLGLILVPNGEAIGYALGDENPLNRTEITALGPRSVVLEAPRTNYHPWGVFFTVLGTVFLDFDADACQSPARAYLLDVTVPEDHAKGLSTFTVMAGLGGFMGYALGGINWDGTRLGDLFGGHVRAVFSLITVIFIVCVTATVTSFSEIPLGELKDQDEFRQLAQTERDQESIDIEDGTEKGLKKDNASYGAVNLPESTPTILQAPEPHGEHLSLSHYLKSIVVMPSSLRVVCLTNLFCWMAHVCYSLYFTDFVGESVFGGNPAAPVGSESRMQYEAGVRFGCWGMAMYSLSCACYSTVIERLIKRLGAKKVYVGGLCTYSCGMFMLCAIRGRAAVLMFSWTAGVMYSTLFTMPYLLVAHYHATGMWDSTGGGCGAPRGIGTDVAVVSSCVFVAQLLISVMMGVAVKVAGSTAAVVAIAAALASAAAVTATRITYLDLFTVSLCTEVSIIMGLLKRLWKKLTYTRALERSSGTFETLFFESVYRVAYITGLSINDNHSLPYRLYSTLAKMLITLLIIGEVWYIFTLAPTIDDILTCINTMLIQLISIYRYKNMLDHKDFYKKLAACMESPYFNTDSKKRRRLVEIWANTNEKYLKVVLALGTCTLAAWFTYPLVDELEYNLIVGIRLPFKYNSAYMYPFAYVLVVIAFTYVAYFVMVTDVLMQAHLIHLLCQFSVLADCYESLVHDCSEEFKDINQSYLMYNENFADMYLKRLGNLVEQHKLILSHTMSLRNSLSRPMLSQLAASGTSICFIGYQAATSQNIGEAIYFSGWESGVSLFPGVRSTIKMVIARANKPLVFTAGGMYNLSLTSFSALVKTSYSALTVLLRFRHN